MPDLELTTKQAAWKLGVTTRTVCNWCQQGKLVGPSSIDNRPATIKYRGVGRVENLIKAQKGKIG